MSPRVPMRCAPPILPAALGDLRDGVMSVDRARRVGASSSPIFAAGHRELQRTIVDDALRDIRQSHVLRLLTPVFCPPRCGQALVDEMGARPGHPRGGMPSVASRLAP